MQIAFVIAAFMALPGLLVSLLTNASTAVLMTLLNNKLFEIESGSNLLKIIDDVFGRGNSNMNYIFGTNTNFLELMANVIMGAGVAISVAIVLLELLSMYMAQLQGEPAENPLKIILRLFVTFLLFLIILGRITPGTSPFVFGGLLSRFSNMATYLLAPTTDGFSAILTEFSTYNLTVVTSLAHTIVLLCLSWALFKGTVEAGIIFVERWLSFAFTILISPICIGFYASKKTEQIFRTWIMSLVGQLLTIFLSIIALRMYFFAQKGLSGIYIDLIVTEIGEGLFFNYALAIALLALYKNSERILNSVGIKTMMNGATLREYGRGARLASSMWQASGGAVIKSFGKGFGMKASGDLTHGLAMWSNRTFGQDSLVSKGLNYADIKKDNTALQQKGNMTYDPNTNKYNIAGNPNMVAKIEGKNPEAYKQSLNNAKEQLNMATAGKLDKVSTSAVAQGMSLGDEKQLSIKGDSMKVSNFKDINGNDRTAFVGETTTGAFLGRNGQSTTSPKVSAFIGGDLLEAGTVVPLTNEDGRRLDYTIAPSSPVRAEGGGAYQYELNPPRPLNQDSYVSSAVSSGNMLSKDSYVAQGRASVESGDFVSQADFNKNSKLSKAYGGNYESYKADQIQRAYDSYASGQYEAYKSLFNSDVQAMNNSMSKGNFQEAWQYANQFTPSVQDTLFNDLNKAVFDADAQARNLNIQAQVDDNLSQFKNEISDMVFNQQVDNLRDFAQQEENFNTMMLQEMFKDSSREEKAFPADNDVIQQVQEAVEREARNENYIESYEDAYNYGKEYEDAMLDDDNYYNDDDDFNYNPNSIDEEE